MRRTHHSASVMPALALLGLLAVSAGSAAGNPNPAIVPVDARVHGKTYGQWSAEHWKWLFSLPVDAHPLADTADCDTGQSGKVRFLGGTFTTIETAPNVVLGEAERDCSVPAGDFLFFPILDAECSTLEGNGETEEELRGCATWLMDHVTEVGATLDGEALEDLRSFRVQSPLFIFGPLPENNVLGAPEGSTSPAVSDGIFLLLRPLAAGLHDLRFTGTLVFTEESDGFDFTFSLDINYHLEIGG